MLGVVYALALEAVALEKRLTGVLSIRGKAFAAKQGGFKNYGGSSSPPASARNAWPRRRTF